MTLNCWHCNSNFEYEPPAAIAGHSIEFYQDSTICKNCIPCMNSTDPCRHEKAATTMVTDHSICGGVTELWDGETA
jgi:hypothetical protein